GNGSNEQALQSLTAAFGNGLFESSWFNCNAVSLNEANNGIFKIVRTENRIITSGLSGEVYPNNSLIIWAENPTAVEEIKSTMATQILNCTLTKNITNN